MVGRGGEDKCDEMRMILVMWWDEIKGLMSPSENTTAWGGCRFNYGE